MKNIDSAYQRYIDACRARREEVRQMHARGKSLAEIGRILGISRQGVYKLLLKA
jgi:DNA-binding CsgD family transcriptional regulator